MTFRAKPAVKRAQRPSPGSSGRRNLYVNLAFGAVILLAVLILALAAGATWYGDRFGAVAKVDGVAITKDQFRDRYQVERFRLSQAQQRVRDAFNAGRLTEAQQNQQLQFLQQRAQQLAGLALERLIDAQLQSTLAAGLGVTVDEAAIETKLTEEATRPEERHVWIIDVEPEVAEGATEPTAAQKAEAKKTADKALADIRGGKAFEDVAKTVSTDPSGAQGGDLGWLPLESGLDKAFMTAVFALQPNGVTDVIEGEDGTFRIGRVTEIAPEKVDELYRQRIVDEGMVTLEAYRAAIRADLLREALEKKIVADVVDTATPQRRVQEIYIAQAQGEGGGDEVKVRHILYSPKDDPESAGGLPADDPGWEEARTEAQAGYEALAPLVGKGEELETAFEERAKKDSDEPGADTSGGDLPYFTREEVDKAFGDAIFTPGLKKGDLLQPVRSQFGWHVILFEDRRLDPEQRMNAAKLEADAGADFGELAKKYSEGEKADSGGDIGWIARGQFDKQLEDAIFAATIGRTTDIVAIDGDGFYLYKVLEEQTRKPDGEQKKTLEETAFNNWYEQKKAAADIYRDPELFTQAEPEIQ